MAGSISTITVAESNEIRLTQITYNTTTVTPESLPEHFLYTHIIPSLSATVHWPRPGGVLATVGFKTMKPASADFVKQDGAVQLSFEVVLQPPLVFTNGVVTKP